MPNQVITLLPGDTACFAPDPSKRQTQVAPSSMLAMQLGLHWQCDNARHSNYQFALKLNMWRDIYPMPMESELVGQHIGDTRRYDFAPGDFIAPYQKRDCLSIRPQQFNPHFLPNGYVAPRAGRFYPKGFIAGTRGIFSEEMGAFRVAEVNDDITIELNHPLADTALTLSTQLLDIWLSRKDGGSCIDIPEILTLDGPGMACRWHNQATDFWPDLPFHRKADTEADDFYAQPRSTDPMDSTAQQQIELLYTRLLPPDSQVLELMASHTSQLPTTPTLHVQGLGLNAEELAANTRLASASVHNLNDNPILPFADNTFDAIVCTAGIAYLTQPGQVFAEVNRVLKPNGLFITTFSNRYFPTKVVKIWEDAHEFERLGLVLEYFLESGRYTDLETCTIRGLPRPESDQFVGKTLFSDPVYAVWGRKKA